MKRKVAAYITHGRRLLLFRHPLSPEAGIQVPAGSVEAGEAWETAVMREAQEETGLRQLRLGRFLKEAPFDHSVYGRDDVMLYRFYHLICEEPSPPPYWRHWEEHASEGEEDRIPFDFFWVTLPHELPHLGGGQAAAIGELLTKMGIDPLPVGEPVSTTPALPPTREPMVGEYVRLRPLRPAADATELYRISHGSAEKEAIWTYMGDGPFANEAAMAVWLAEIATDSETLIIIETAITR